MGFLKTRKNKKYGYEPRYYNNDGQGRPFEIKHKFDDQRKTVGKSPGIKGRFNNAMAELKEQPDKVANRRIILIASIFILIFLYIIDFDLSIFFPS